jgi:hypothetical protein
MTTFTTTISKMYTLPQVAGQTDVVVTIFYLVSGVDGQYIASIAGSQQFTVEQGSEFTPYPQLTQDQVIGWIPAIEIANAQTCVQGQIDSMITPPISPAAQTLPWTTSTT